MDGLRSNAVITQEQRVRGRPFAPGYPGRRPGSRNKASLAAEALLEGEAEALTRKAVEIALSGDTTALRLCLERLLPPRKDRPVSFQLPPLASARDAAQASAALLLAVAEGELTPLEAADLPKLLTSYVEALKTSDMEERLLALEAEASR
jgi:hypothetical protein